MSLMAEEGDDVEIRAAQQNELTYGRATSAIWQLAVYDVLHGGRRFANIAGRDLLDFAGEATPLSDASHVLELCCGVGDTCRYIEERFRCRVTGVEWNRRQIELARAAAPASRVQFIEADIRSFDTALRFDLVLALDSLSLVPSLELVLRNAGRLLVSGGALVVSDILAGPNLTAALRAFTWELDAVVNLPTPDDYGRSLAAAGLRSFELADLTDRAEAAFTAIGDALQRHEERLVGECGAADVEEWRSAAWRYADAFARRELLYARIMARRAQ